MALFRTLVCGAFLAAVPVASVAHADDASFFRDVEGRWVGPGEIVAGKYKGTRFNCDLTGVSAGRAAGVDLEGTCRVGVFSQSMKASVRQSGKNYRGQFLDGAKGKGLDITSGNVDGGRVVLALIRDQLRGAMLARVSQKNNMNVTISVDVQNTMVPVIAMNLKRVDGKSTASTD